VAASRAEGPASAERRHASSPPILIGGGALGYVEVAAQPVMIARLTYQIARSIKRVALPAFQFKPRVLMRFYPDNAAIPRTKSKMLSGFRFFHQRRFR
jgi:hypothetical protein